MRLFRFAGEKVFAMDEREPFFRWCCSHVRGARRLSERGRECGESSGGGMAFCFGVDGAGSGHPVLYSSVRLFNCSSVVYSDLFLFFLVHC